METTDRIYARITLAREYAVITGMLDTLTRGAKEAAENFRAILNKVPLPGGKSIISDKDMEEIMAGINDSIPGFIEAATIISAETYTTEELQALVDFYKSPVGASILKKTPEVEARAHQLKEAWIKSIQHGLHTKLVS